MFIEESLKSVLNQTRLPQEIVVVDDSSSDKTDQVVESVARHSPLPIHLLRLPRNSGGPSKPLNLGIETARGEVMVILEQDDLMRKSRIETQLTAMLRHPESSLATGHFAVLGNNEGDMSPLWPVPQFHDLGLHVDKRSDVSIVAPQIAFLALLNRNFGINSSFSFTKTSYRKIGGFDETVNTCADLDFILRAAETGSIAVVNDVVVDYRWRGDSLYRRDTAKSTLEAMMVRLRAASRRHDWARDSLPAIRHSALALAGSSLARGDSTAISALVEILGQRGGLKVIGRSLRNKVRLVGDSFRRWMDLKY